MFPQWSIVGFTGHRDLTEPGQVAAQIDLALNRLSDAFGPLAAVSSLAKGADMLFLAEVTRRKLPLWLQLPFPLGRLEKDFSPTDWEKVRPYFKAALQVEEITGTASDDEAYMEVGENVVELADVVVAVWDGKPAAGLGGTADIVDHARELGKPLIWINPIKGTVLEERLYRLTPKQDIGPWNNTTKEMVEQYFREQDDKARLHAPRARHLVQRIILLHLLASAVGLSVPTFGVRGFFEYAIAALELGVLSVAIVLTAAHRRRHEEWIQSRIEAEICRSFLAIWQIRRRTGHSFKMALQGFDKLCKNLRLLQSLDSNPPPDLLDARDSYLEQRLEGQITYFQEQSTTARRAHGRLKIAALCCTSAAALLIASCMGLSAMGSEGLTFQISKFLTLILPLISAALFSITLTLEYSRRAARYQEMAVFLEQKAKRLRKVRTWNGLIGIATDVEEQLVQEVVEWHSYSRFVTTSH